MLLIEKVVYNYSFKPRVIVPQHPSRHLTQILFVPIKGNRILLLAKYRGNTVKPRLYRHLSIHEICSNNRIGLTLWLFNGSVDGRFNILDLELIKSTKNALGITLGVRFDDHWKLFDISTTDTVALDHFPLIESGRMDFDLKLKSPQKSVMRNRPGLSEIFMLLY